MKFALFGTSCANLVFGIGYGEFTLLYSRWANTLRQHILFDSKSQLTNNIMKTTNYHLHNRIITYYIPFSID